MDQKNSFLAFAVLYCICGRDYRVFCSPKLSHQNQAKPKNVLIQQFVTLLLTNWYFQPSSMWRAMDYCLTPLRPELHLFKVTYIHSVHHGATIILLCVLFLSPPPHRCWFIVGTLWLQCEYRHTWLFHSTYFAELIADALLVLFYIQNTVQRTEHSLNSTRMTT